MTSQRLMNCLRIDVRSTGRCEKRRGTPGVFTRHSATPMATSKDGQVVWIQPEDIIVDDDSEPNPTE